MKAHDIDIIVGKKIRELRVKHVVSQEELGALIGVSFQQIQKYERASNRVTAGKLAIIARFFSVPVGSFFQESDLDGADFETLKASVLDRKLMPIISALPHKQKVGLLGFLRPEVSHAKH